MYVCMRVMYVMYMYRYKKFIQETQKQLWAPRKIGKAKWSETQVYLVVCMSNLARAIIDDDRVDVFWDSSGHLKDWSIEERYTVRL